MQKKTKEIHPLINFEWYGTACTIYYFDESFCTAQLATDQGDRGRHQRLLSGVVAAASRC